MERNHKDGYLGSPAPDYPELPPALARLLDRFPQLWRWPHPMLARFPIVFLLSATSFSLLFRFTGDRAFDDTAFYCLGGGLLTLPPTVATGLFTGWLNFTGEADRTVRIEKALSYAEIFITAAAFVWRWLDPLVLMDLNGVNLIYFVLVMSLTPLVTANGYFGGMLTFPLEEEDAGCPKRMIDVKEKPDKEREWTPAELAACSGADGSPIYIAFRGKVYDVSGSGLWDSGDHMGQHHAGHDLTDEFPDAPHGEEVFARYPQVGVLKQEAAAPETPAAKTSAAREFWQRVVKRVPLIRRHPHPMVVHFPIVFMIAAPVFTLLALITGVKSFEVTGFHCLGGGVLFTPVAIVTGWFTWWLNYESRWLRPVVIKLIASPVLLLAAVGAFVWRYQNPEILAPWGDSSSLIYLGLMCALIPLVSVIGACGAELTFPVKSE